MQLTQLVYVSSYASDHGLDLPNFIESLIFSNERFAVRGMTLFASGNLIALLEGDHPVVNDIFNKRPNTAKHSKLPGKIPLFKLSVDEVDKRIAESRGKVLMMQFAFNYGKNNGEFDINPN